MGPIISLNILQYPVRYAKIVTDLHDRYEPIFHGLILSVHARR